MPGFEKISVNGFRRLCNLELELRPLSVLIGANGAGKTSFLDVFDLLAASAESRLNSKLSELSGLTALLTSGGPGRLSLGLSMTVPNSNPIEYELNIAPSGTTFTIEKEVLSQRRKPHLPEPLYFIQSSGSDIKYFEVEEKNKGLVRPNWEHIPLETSLSQVPKMFREPEEFRRDLASSTFYHALNVEPRAPVRLPQPMRPAKLPGKDGEDLVPCLYYMRETDRDRFDAIEDALRAAFPGFQRLDFPPVAAGTLAMMWRDTNFPDPMYAHQLSEGTLRFLWLATLLQSPELSAVTLIDEPEVSLHPELLNLLADLMREASERTQLIVATHSDRFVRFLEPKEVVVMDIEDDGLATATWADQLDLDKWLEEYSLDEVWAMGRMGGRS